LFSKRKIINVIFLTIMVMILTQSSFVNGSTYEDSHPLRISQTKKVVFAQNNGYFSPTNAYSDLNDTFIAHGYDVEEIITGINATVLASTSILFVNTYQNDSFSANEITAIENFVYSGGGLIISFAGGGLDLGCKITNSLGILGNNDLEVYPHPITANIPVPIIATNSGYRNITLSASAQTIVSTDPGSDSPNATMIATNYYGEGKIMASTVATIWNNTVFANGGNDNLIENYLKWFEDDGIKNFVFAENNGYFSPTNASSELAHYIASFGYIITELIDQDPTETILSSTDILLINSYQETSGYSTDSLTAIEEWVANGGALIVVFRGIATDFGLHMYTIGQPDLLYTNETYHIFYHPVTSGITNITKSVQGSVAEFDLAESATVIVSTTANSTNPERPIIAVNNYDEGKVMASAIPLWDKNFDFDENKELMKNFIDWVTINTTTPSPWISTHPDISYNESSVGNNLTWTMESYYPYYFALLLDGEDYLSGTWSSLPLMVNIDGLLTGNYTFTIHIYDHYGRTASDTVLVTVTQVTGTTTTTSAPFSFLGTLLGVSMVISVTFYRRRKRN